MYTPKHFKAHDRAEILGFMRQYPFAAIITVKDNFQTATHLPFVITEVDGHILLAAHFAKANKQWKGLTHHKVLVVFTEPHAYISPAHYEKELNVPTWNYMAVHAYGKGEILEGADKAFELLESMMHSFEEDYIKQWKTLPMDYKLKMVEGIVPFQIRVTDLQATKKLSQNKTELERQRIISSLGMSDQGHEKQIAQLMQQEEIKNRDIKI